MAYAATVTVKNVGSNLWEVTIDETDAGNGDFTEVEGIPMTGSVLEVRSELLSGAGATVCPRLTKTSPPASAIVPDIVVQPIETPAASQSNRGSALYTCAEQGTTGGKLYHAATVNAGSNNVIRTVYNLYGNVW